VDVPAAVASAASVIVNEFVSNSLKYAFAPDQAGKIWLDGRMTGDRQLVLCCRDDGRGIASGDTQTGLGLMAMRACAEQVCGSISVDAPASGYQITFSCNVPAI
jgi:two-component sensor histidine kinase